jgi:hypothetical protein
MSLGWIAVCCVALTTPLTRGEDKKDDKKDEPKVADGIYRIVINQGDRRTVEVVGKGDVSPSQIAAEQDAARAETEANFVGELQDLKRQYVANERLFAQQRFTKQMQLYGNSISSTNSSALVFGDGYRGYGYGGWGWGWGGGWGYPGGITGYLSNTTTVNQDLSIGAGPEGSLQTELSRVIAAQATPEYAAVVRRNLGNALAYRDDPKKGKGTLTADEPTAKATLTLKNGKEITGLLLKSRDKEWINLQVDKSVVRVRSSDVAMQKLEPVKEGARFAVDD